VDPHLVKLDPDQTRLIVAGLGLPMTASEMSRSGGIDPHRIAATGKRLGHCRRRYEPPMLTVLNDRAADARIRSGSAATNPQSAGTPATAGVSTAQLVISGLALLLALLMAVGPS